MNLKEYIRHIKSICKQGILRHKNVILDETFQKELLEIIKCYEQLQQENQQLKEHLHQKEDIIDKVIKWIENDYYSMNTTDIDSIFVRNNKLVQIRKFLKGDK